MHLEEYLTALIHTTVGDVVRLVNAAPADGVPDAPAAAKMRGQSKATYDELGRAYLMEANHVDPVNGAVSKLAYDGVSRTTVSYVSDGGGDRPGAIRPTWSATECWSRVRRITIRNGIQSRTS